MNGQTGLMKLTIFGLPPVTNPRADVPPYETVDDVNMDISNIKYHPRGQRPTSHIHVGQLKLFLSTFQFLNDFADRDRITNVVYPGSAPGQNIPLLADLFPTTRWFLCDPRPLHNSVIRHKSVVWTKKDLFKDKYIDELKTIFEREGHKVLLISDIRDVTDTAETSIHRDMKLQQGWVESMRPDYAQLKFRIPRLGSDSYRYLDGDTYLQFFACVASTECRLVVDGRSCPTKDWSLSEYENSMFAFNSRLRVHIYPTLSFARKQGYDGCHDCYASSKMVEDYCIKHNASPKKMLSTIMNIPSVRYLFDRETRSVKDVMIIYIYI